MANGRIAIGKNSGGIQYIEPTDSASNSTLVLPESGILVTKEATVDIYNSHIPMSSFTSYHLLQGNLAVDNFVTTQGMNTTLYTGNGTTQSINTGIDMATQWGNTAEEKFGGLVWYKSRSSANFHALIDSIRGATINNFISSNSTNAEGAGGSITGFTSTGFDLTYSGGGNNSGATFASWNFQTTHRVSGTTNHGKAYTCHYNPYTGFTIVKYAGSGIAGHEIPHHLGRKLGFATVKCLTASATNWSASYEDGNIVYINTTAGYTSDTNRITSISNESNIIVGTAGDVNSGTNSYILYGWANSYYDENKLIGNYEIGVYQGTGAAGNKVTTRGKPAWVMVKRLDSTGGWLIFDNKRLNSSDPFDAVLFANASDVEGTGWNPTFHTVQEDGFTMNTEITGDRTHNASGGQYLYMVAYDTNANGGGSYYPLASDTANVQINNGIIPLAHGIDSNGSKNSIVVANETITGVTYTEGKNYLYKTDTGYGVKSHRPRYLSSELVRKFAGEQPDYYDVESNKWFNCDAGSELVTNGKFDANLTGWTDADVGTGSSTWSNGQMYLAGTASNYAFRYQQINGLVIGKKYKFKFLINNISGTIYITLSNTSIIADYISGFKAYSTSSEVEFMAENTTVFVQMWSSTSSSCSGYIEDVSVFPADIVPTTEITESRNYMNHIVHADADGGVLYVEELPKIEYKNVIKAEEYLGKNACTAWVNFDGTTTPPTIMDSYNVSAVIRVATGTYDIYFEKYMDNVNYCPNSNAGNAEGGNWDAHITGTNLINKFRVISINPTTGSAISAPIISAHIFGGKN